MIVYFFSLILSFRFMGCGFECIGFGCSRGVCSCAVVVAVYAFGWLFRGICHL